MWQRERSGSQRTLLCPLPPLCIYTYEPFMHPPRSTPRTAAAGLGCDQALRRPPYLSDCREQCARALDLTGPPIVAVAAAVTNRPTPPPSDEAVLVCGAIDSEKANMCCV